MNLEKLKFLGQTQLFELTSVQFLGQTYVTGPRAPSRAGKGSTCSARERVRRACDLLRRGVPRGVLRSMAATLTSENAGSRAARRACRACVSAD